MPFPIPVLACCTTVQPYWDQTIDQVVRRDAAEDAIAYPDSYKRTAAEDAIAYPDSYKRDAAEDAIAYPDSYKREAEPAEEAIA